MNDQVSVAGLMPNGQSYMTVVSGNAVAVRIAERACVTHPQWMTRAELTRLMHTIGDLLAGWPCDHEWADIHGVRGCGICRIACPDCDGTGEEVRGAGHMFGTNYCETCSGEMNQ